MIDWHVLILLPIYLSLSWNVTGVYVLSTTNNQLIVLDSPQHAIPCLQWCSVIWRYSKQLLIFTVIVWHVYYFFHSTKCFFFSIFENNKFVAQNSNRLAQIIWVNVFGSMYSVDLKIISNCRYYLYEENTEPAPSSIENPTRFKYYPFIRTRFNLTDWKWTLKTHMKQCNSWKHTWNFQLYIA